MIDMSEINPDIIADSLTFPVRGFVHAICKDEERYNNLEQYYKSFLNIQSKDSFVNEISGLLYKKLVGNIRINTAYDLYEIITINRKVNKFDESELKYVLTEFSLIKDNHLPFELSKIFIRKIFNNT